MLNKRGQLTIFIILAVVLVGGLVIFFAFREDLFIDSIPQEFQPVFQQYSSCIQQELENAIDLSETQGGRVFVQDYIPGSEFAPFSSNLNFLDNPVPYWFYLSGNGIIKENVPTKTEIEKEIGQFIQERINDCNFQDFYDQEFYISLNPATAKVNINDETVQVDITTNFVVSKEDQTARRTTFKTVVNSKLGKFYNTAAKIYSKQKNEAFLEEYAIDALRNYAPVDGVETSCSPKIWKTQEVTSDIRSALEANIQAIKLKGDYYSLSSKENEYFVVDEPVDEAVNLLYFKDWPSKIEILGEGVDNELIVASPIGNQQGLGILGFCYVPYHFVYDLSFPVMIQISAGAEIFQFPVTVIIDNNLPRKAELNEFAEQGEDFDVCKFKTQDIAINTFDVNLNPIEANLSYVCFDQECNLGETKDGRFEGKAPSCLNGFIHARSSGFSEKSQIFSTNSETDADIIIDREYDVQIDLKIAGQTVKSTAIVTFAGEKTSAAALPDQTSLKLSEGLYNISVFIYGNSSVSIPASTKTQCIEISRGGLAGIIGLTKEQCVDIEIPATKIDYALIGGGKSSEFLLESELQKGRIVIDSSELPYPNSLEQLQYNLESFDSLGLDIQFI